ncbi:MAG TPA: type II secretion system protein [Verrucomicrobiae bacterium]|nr:type II secretion system protein [Verrucomicrobiae bacterium]
MKTHQGANWNQAVTLIDVLIVIAVVLLLGALILPRLAHVHVNTARNSCASHLKQVGLAFQLWSEDNGNKYPMAVSTNQRGSMERALAGDIVLTFQVMSNELSTPRVLVCRADERRTYVTNFTDLTGDNISYFVGVDATATNATMFLGGDRNLTIGKGISSGLQSITTNQAVRWTSEIHKNAGNVLLVDGSVQQFSSSGLREALAKTGVATNRLAFP